MAKFIRHTLALMAALLLLSGCNSDGDGKSNSVKAQRDAQYAALATADAR